MTRRAALVLSVVLFFGVANLALFLALWWYAAP